MFERQRAFNYKPHDDDDDDDDDDDALLVVLPVSLLSILITLQTCINWSSRSATDTPCMFKGEIDSLNDVAHRCYYCVTCGVH